MKISEKVKYWARIGQVSVWLCWFLNEMIERQLPTYEPPAISGTATEFMFVIGALYFAMLFSEAIVRVIVLFAELLDR